MTCSYSGFIYEIFIGTEFIQGNICEVFLGGGCFLGVKEWGGQKKGPGVFAPDPFIINGVYIEN